VNTKATYCGSSHFGLARLFELAAGRVDEVYGYTVQGEALALTQLRSISDLPVGLRSQDAPGSARLVQTDQATLFGHTVSCSSLKSLVHPARRRVLQAHRDGGGLQVIAEPSAERVRLAFGVRACDLASILVLDRVFLSPGRTEGDYAERRGRLFLITATCTQPSNMCFCSSMGGGSRTTASDINITEWLSGCHVEPIYIFEAGTEWGREVLADWEQEAASELRLRPSVPTDFDADLGAVVLEISRTSDAEMRSRPRPYESIAPGPHLMNRAEAVRLAIASENWQQVGDRCLACGNCTMVCPTCFCTTVQDLSDLKGERAERWLEWDSCFSADHSLLTGGPVRRSVSSRYRQWLTHKMGTWPLQFGISGCVGCGRCATWCPVGIDIVAETIHLTEERRKGHLND
jgi:sulfhydrogenase subunit beta (sulfur reductase)